MIYIYIYAYIYIYIERDIYVIHIYPHHRRVDPLRGGGPPPPACWPVGAMGKQKTASRRAIERRRRIEARAADT